MSKIKVETSVLMVNCGVPEYTEASSEIDEDELEKNIEKNIECQINLPESSRDYA